MQVVRHFQVETGLVLIQAFLPLFVNKIPLRVKLEEKYGAIKSHKKAQKPWTGGANTRLCGTQYFQQNFD